MNKAIFFDRDGTLNSIVLGEYIVKFDEIILIDGVVKAIRKANAAGYLCIVITNQGGAIYKKGLTRGEVEQINESLVKFLDDKGAKIDRVYVCPHYPSIEACNCRKPKVGLIDKAISDFNISVQKSYMIGDSDSDMIAGNKARLKTIAIGKRIKSKSDFCAQNVKEAVDYILKER